MEGLNVTRGVLKRMKEVFSTLTDKERTDICNTKRTVMVKKIEAQANVSNRQACRYVAEELGENPDSIRKAVARVENKVGTNVPKKERGPQQLSIVDKVAVKMGANASQSGAIREVAKEAGVSVNTVKSKVQREAKKYAEKQTFNRTDDSAIEWAKYTWNPVTGCKHGCKYCYAEKIASRKMGAYKGIGFTPHLHEERLAATENLPRNVAEVDRFCFVVSMGDLFGEWVPDEWITKVMDAIRKAPEWTFLLLTKNPGRYAKLGYDFFPENCWLGASGGTQSLVSKAVESFRVLHEESDFLGDMVTFLSCEPLTEEITFIDECVDWVIIGSQTNPVIHPDYKIIMSVVHQCVHSGIKLYFKPNLLFLPKEKPKTKKEQNDKSKKDL